MEFERKNEQFVSEWLQQEGFKETVVEAFRGISSRSMFIVILIALTFDFI